MQTRKGQGNIRTSSDKYKPIKEALPGLPIDPPRRTGENGYSHVAPLRHSGRLSTTGLPTGPEIDAHISHLTQARAADFPTTSGPVVARSNTARMDRRLSNKYMQVSVNQASSKHNHLDAANSSEKHEWTHHLLDEPSSSQKKDDRTGDKESTTVSSRSKVDDFGYLFI